MRQMAPFFSDFGLECSCLSIVRFCLTLGLQDYKFEFCAVVNNGHISEACIILF
jgi:hypothetical protein